MRAFKNKVFLELTHALSPGSSNSAPDKEEQTPDMNMLLSHGGGWGPT